MSTENMINVAVPAGTSTVYERFFLTEDYDLTIGTETEDGEILVAILIDEYGEVFEWFTEHTWHETVDNYAKQAPILVYWDNPSTTEQISVIANAKRSRREYGNCFDIDVNEKTLEQVNPNWVNGTDPKFTSKLF